jgi:anti-sigma factor RsiW
MYQDPTGARLTLYVADAGPQSGDTAFRFDRDGRIAAFYWIDGRFGYALSAQTDRATLLALAEEVYRQLSRASRPPA